MKSSAKVKVIIIVSILVNILLASSIVILYWQNEPEKNQLSEQLNILIQQNEDLNNQLKSLRQELEITQKQLEYYREQAEYYSSLLKPEQLKQVLREMRPSIWLQLKL